MKYFYSAIVLVSVLIASSATAQVDELRCEDGTTKCGYPPYGVCCTRDQRCCAVGLGPDQRTVFSCSAKERPCGRED